MANLVSPSTETKLTNLNFDCLEKIFRLLSLNDLLNVADSNKQLRNVADSVFSYKYGKKKLLIIYPCLLMEEDTIRKYGFLEPESLFIGYWKRCYQILRSFGHYMEKVELNIRLNGLTDSLTYNKSFGSLCKNFFTYLSKYCADSLNEINIAGQLLDGTLNHLEKPFQLVETVIIAGNFEKNILTDLFPKLRHLVFDYAYSSDFLSIDSYFPHLESMTLTYLCVEPSHDIVSQHYAQIFSFLNLNPKLKSLTSPTIANENFLQTITNCVPNLQSLSLYDRYLYFANYSVAQFKHLKVFAYPVLRFPKMLHTFDRLEELRCSNSRGEEFFDFLAKNPSIREINTVDTLIKVYRTYFEYWLNF